MVDFRPPESTPFYASKTFWASVLTAAAPWIPGVGPIVALHPEYVVSGLGAVFLLLRTVTKGSLTLK